MIPPRLARDLDLPQLALAIVGVFVLAAYAVPWQAPALVLFDGRLAQLGVLPAYAAGLLILAAAPLSALKGLLRQPFLLALLILAAASVLWSIDPAASARRVLFLVMTTLGGVAIAARFSWRELVEIVAAGFLVAAAASFAVAALAPGVGVIDGAWRGLWPDAETLAAAMALGAAAMAAAALLNPARTFLWCACAVFAGFVMVMTGSRPGLQAAVLVILAVCLVVVMRQGRGAAPPPRIAGWLGFAILALLALFAFEAAIGGSGARPALWSAVLSQIAERPWTGLGYDAAWSRGAGEGPFAWLGSGAAFQAGRAHGAWLEVWLGLGLWGLAALGLLVIQTVALTIAALFARRPAAAILPFLTVWGLLTVTQSLALAWNDLRWAAFVALAVKLVLPDPETPRAAA